MCCVAIGTGSLSERPAYAGQVSAFADWPVNTDAEIPYLKSKLGWKNPQILGGVTEPIYNYLIELNKGNQSRHL